MDVMGGSKGSTSSHTGGFNDLPEEIKSAFTKLATEAQGYIGPTGTAAYTPMPLTAGETSALGKMTTGFTPTQSTIESDIAMQTNPYDKYVIDEINRQSQGDYSLVKQAQDTAGQFGSNRGMLGANDIDLSRLNQIGTFKQNQYNTALNNSLNTLTKGRRTDAVAALGAGGYERGIDSSTKQAGINSLTAIAQILGILPKTEGSTDSSGSSSSSEGFLKYLL